MAERMSKTQRQQKALLEAIAFHDRGRMISDLMACMVYSVPYISWQRRYIAFLIAEINNLPPEVPEWQPSLDVVDRIREEINQERALSLISNSSQPTGRYNFLRRIEQPLSRPAIPRTLSDLPFSNSKIEE